MNDYYNYYNYSLSTLLVVFGLVAGGGSFTFYHLRASLIAMFVGAVVLIRKGNVILSRLARKRDETMMLIAWVLYGSVDDVKLIAEGRMRIHRS